MAIHLILGTAGHIDHGKSSLIRALTGIDTDRLPDEKRRGITIDLGFAELDLGDYRLGIVDVPGHERFVRNMLAGATGTDLALLVVAADDSVKPQTREHLEILRLLGIRSGVIAITKCDLADPDWVDLVEEEVRELVEPTFLANAPMIRTSTTSGKGIQALRVALSTAAKQVCTDRSSTLNSAPFRMAVDRAFTIAGHGTVVTGSVSSGTANIGDELLLEPGSNAARVRSIQSHDHTLESVSRGQRAAINLVGIHHKDVVRGQELTSPGCLRPSKCLTVNISLLDSTPRALRHRTRVRIHIGTAEVMASVLLFETERLEPGCKAKAQLLLSQACVTSWRQAFVVRSESPVATVGGGQVLDPNADVVRNPTADISQKLDDLAADDAILRGSAALYFAGIHGWQPDNLPFRAGIENTEEVFHQLVQRQEVVEVELSPIRSVQLHRLFVEQLRNRIELTLRKMHTDNPRRSRLERSKLLSRFEYLDNTPLLTTILDKMRQEGTISVSDYGITLKGCGPNLSQKEKILFREIVENFRQSGCQPPSVKDLQGTASKFQQVIPDLISLAVADGELVEIARDLYLHADVDRQLRETLRQRLANETGLTISQMREILGTTRKYAVPLAEYLDRIGFTRREGNLRMLGTKES